MSRHREGKPHIHAAAIAFHRGIEECSTARKFDEWRQTASNFGAEHAQRSRRSGRHFARSNNSSIPVKRYSSGMYVRLASRWRLILSRRSWWLTRCLPSATPNSRQMPGKNKDVARGGRTVLFVSHHMHRFHSYATGQFIWSRKAARTSAKWVGRLNFTSQFSKAVRRNTQAAEPAGNGRVPFHRRDRSQEFFGCSDEKTIQFSIERSALRRKIFHLLSSAQRDRRCRCPNVIRAWSDSGLNARHV